MKKVALGCRLSAVGLMLAMGCASVGAAAQPQEMSSFVRVHRIYPVVAAEAPVAEPAGPSAEAQEPMPGAGAGAVKLEDLPRLTVRGHANLDKPADRLLLDIGSVNQAETPTGALQENSRLMTEVIKAIRKAGLGDGDYQTGHIDLQPVYTQPPRGGVGPDWQPRIIAYRASNSVRVRTRKLDLAGALIQAANDAGANQIGNISFDLADPRVHRAEAIKVATANALTDARTLAEAAGVNLVRIVMIDLDPFSYQPVQTFSGQMMRTAMAESIAPPVTPGDVTVSAGVTIVYEIRQR